MKQLFKNNASSTLASSITSGAATLDVAAGGGAKFPVISGSDVFTVTVTSSDGSTQEIMTVTATATDTFSITRAQEGTSAAAFSAGATVKLLLTAGPLTTIMAFLGNAALAAIAALTPAADKIAYFTSSSAAALTTLSSFMRTVLDDADAATARTTLGLGTAATQSTSAFLQPSNNLSDVGSASTSRTNLSVYSTSQVDTAIAAAVAGLSWKQAVRAATTANGTLSTAYANGQTVDGVTLATGDRILIKNQSAPSENGIYVVAASGAPTRATDADSGAELVNASCYVSEGTTNADTQWTCTTNATITVGSTSLAFAQLSAGGGGALSTLTDVVLTSPSDAQVLKYDAGSSKWINATVTSGPGAHVYWSILGSGSGLIAGYTAMQELVFRDGAGSTISISGGTPLESGHFSTFAVANAFDGNTATFWESGNTGIPYIGMQFASAVAVRSVGISKAASMDGSSVPSVGIVRYSDNGTDWTSCGIITPSTVITSNDTLYYFGF